MVSTTFDTSPTDTRRRPRRRQDHTGGERDAGMTAPRPLATMDEVAEHLRTTANAVKIMRYKGEGPRFIKVGSRVLYDWDDVEAYTAANTATRTGMGAVTTESSAQDHRQGRFAPEHRLLRIDTSRRELR